MTLNVDMTDIRGEFEDTVYMYGSRLRQEGIQLRAAWRTTERFRRFPATPSGCGRCFLNILDNAAKHGRRGQAD